MKRLFLSLLLCALLAGCTPPAAESPAAAPTATAPPVSTPAETTAPSAVPGGVAVWTDDSQLEPRPTPLPEVYERRHREFTDHLIPSKDYGPLIPFPGGKLARDEDHWEYWEYDLYGLMTLEGEVVVDPVFSSAFRPSLWDETDQCLILQKAVMDDRGEPVGVTALCAGDGSWRTGFDYSYDWELMMDSPGKDVILLRRRGDGSRPSFYQDLAFLDVRTGEEVKTVGLSRVLERWSDAVWSLIYNLRYDERYAIFSDGTVHYLFDADAGEVRCLEELLGCEIKAPYSSSFSEGLCPVKTASGWGYIDGSGGWAIAPAYEQADAFENGHALVADQKTGYYACIDHGGNTVFTFPDCNIPTRFGEFISYQEYDGAVFQEHFLDKDLNPIPLPAEFTDPSPQGDWFIQSLPDPSPAVPGGCAFWNYKTGVRQDFSNAWDYSSVIREDRAILRGKAGSKAFALADLNTGELTPLGQWSSVYFEADKLTGAVYLRLEDRKTGRTEWRDLSGEILYTAAGYDVWVSFYDGRVLACRDEATTLTDADGTLLFSWPIRGTWD